MPNRQPAPVAVVEERPASREKAFPAPTLTKRGVLPKITTAFGGTFTP